MTPHRPVDLLSKARHFLQVMAFALAIATIQYAFMPNRPYGPPVVYSLLIATFTWAVIDLGREVIPSAADTGWPQGWQGFALVATGIAVGYVAGSRVADLLCSHFFHFYPAGAKISNTDQRNSILITALAGIAGSYYFYAYHKASYLQRHVREARQHADEARLKLLETQLEPHMLFNTLANLRVLIATDPDRAQQMLDHIIGYLRATLSASRSTLHPLQDEFDRLRDYLELMAVRMGPRLHFDLDLPETLQNAPVPPLVLQPLVENAIRHGLEPQVEGGHILVQARTQERDGRPWLTLEVRDSGVGLQTQPAPPTAPGRSFGLTQIRERLATLYGSAGTFEIHAMAPHGTCARIVFPLTPLAP